MSPPVRRVLLHVLAGIDNLREHRDRRLQTWVTEYGIESRSGGLVQVVALNCS
jgi:hypothetical protein